MIKIQNFQTNKNLLGKIALGSLTLALLATGCSKNNNQEKSTNVDEYLQEYIEKRDKLTSEIAELEAKKEELEKLEAKDVKKSEYYNMEKFNLDDLVVVEWNVSKDDSKLFIAYADYQYSMYYEYHNLFPIYEESSIENSEYKPTPNEIVVSADKIQPLVNYLTTDELLTIGYMGGEIDVEHLDTIQVRISNDCSKLEHNDNYSLGLKNN